VPTPSTRDRTETAERLAAWFEDRLGEPVDVEIRDGPAFSGFSNETLVVNAFPGGRTAAPLPVVVRVEPGTHQVFPDTAFALQVEVLQRLRARTDIPVPEVLWYEPDQSVFGGRFFVMRRVDGRVPPDNPPYHAGGWLLDVGPATRAAVWWNGLAAMAAVHGIDFRSCGLDGVTVRSASESLAAVDDYGRWVLAGRPFPLVERARAWRTRPRGHRPVSAVG
jgi:aminoglycoside phosphotransferase (APT) family kinase protein